jgi:threonine dehydrogenase-like Zn-dependent dehydrogenase
MGLGELFLSEAAMTVPVPEGPVEELVLAQPLGTVVHACLKLPNVLGQTAIVLGQGPMGQLFTALLRQMGVLRVIAVDLLPERLEVSRQMGATHVVCGDAEVALEAVRDITGGAMADFAVEAVGEQETVDEAATLVRRNGTVLVFGVPHSPRYDLHFTEIFRREARLISSVGPDIQREFPIAVEMIASGALNVKPLVTHQMPYTQMQEAYSMFAERRDGVIKAVLRCDG